MYRTPERKANLRSVFQVQEAAYSVANCGELRPAFAACARDRLLPHLRPGDARGTSDFVAPGWVDVGFDGARRGKVRSRPIGSARLSELAAPGAVKSETASMRWHDIGVDGGRWRRLSNPGPLPRSSGQPAAPRWAATERRSRARGAEPQTRSGCVAGYRALTH